MNALLAHQPWRLKVDDIQNLIDKSSFEDPSGSNEDLWSVTELVHVFIILASIHVSCGFILGQGVLLEREMESATEYHRNQVHTHLYNSHYS